MSLIMEFFPHCANLLDIISASGNRKTRFSCFACPYVCPINVKIVRKQVFKMKEIEPIFEANDFKYAPKTAATCPRCHNGEAYFRQIQIHSADLTSPPQVKGGGVCAEAWMVGKGLWEGKDQLVLFSNNCSSFNLFPSASWHMRLLCTICLQVMEHFGTCFQFNE